MPVFAAFIFRNRASIMTIGASTGPRKVMRQHNFNLIIFGYMFAYWQFASAASANTELSKMRDCTEIELEAVIDQDASREDNLARLSQQFFQSVNTIEHCDRDHDSVDAASSTDSDRASSSADTDGADPASDGGGAADSTASTDADAEKANNTGTDATSTSSEQMTASSDSENPTNIESNNTATDSSASSMAATQNTNQLDTQPTSQSGGQSGGQSTGQATRPAVTPTASGSLVGTNFDQTMTEPAPAFAAPSASNMAGTTPQPTPAETNTTGAQADATEQDLTLTNGKTPDDIPDADNDSVFEAQIRAAAMAETDPDTKKNLWNEYRRYKGLPEQK